MGSGFLKKKKQAKMFQEQLSSMQGAFSEKLEAIEVTGTAANGLVTVILSGNHEMKKLSIKPECVDKDDIDGLETLIKAAYNDACEKLKSQIESPSMGMPDISSMFGM